MSKLSKYMENKRKEQEKNKNTTPSEKNNGSTGKLSKYIGNRRAEELKTTINFDTLQNDLTSLSKTIDSVFNGWQTRETMENTRSSVQSMYDRLGKYQDYTKQYGGTDLSELQSAYKSVLDGWDDLSKNYGRYKNADAYNNAVKAAKKSAQEYEGMKTANLGTVQTEVSDLEKIFNVAKEYDDKAMDYSKKSMNLRNPSAVDGFSKSLKKLTDERDAYLKSVGYESMDALKKALGEKKVYLNKAQRVQDGISLSSVSDINSDNYDKDFNKYAEKGKALGKEKNDWWNGGGTYKNQIAYLRENPDYLETYEDVADDNGKMVESLTLNQLTYVAAKYMTDDEAKIYNYYVGKDDEEGAEKYLKSIEETLKQRQGGAIYDEREGMLSKYTFGYTAGIDQFTQGIINVANTKDDYIPTTGIQNASALVREDIAYEHGTLGQVGYDLINTTSNMLPSILTSTVVGAVATPVAGHIVGAGLMGTSAAGGAYQEMLNLGYDKSQARTYSKLVGLSEAGLQYLMGGIGKLGGVSGKLSKVVSGIDNGLAKFAIRWGGSALSEGFEEAAQEVLNPLFTNIAAGYDTGAEIDWSEVVYSGLLGALSGGVLEGGGVAVNSYAESSFNKRMGQTIKSNERVGDVFDIASNPEVASAYDVYTRYAKKGINADNIKDAQLGRLYTTARADAVETLESKKTTAEQKTGAMQTLAKLSAVETENTIKKEAKKFNIGEETKVTDSGDAVNIKDLKVTGEDVKVVTEKGEISVDDITLTQNDAELVAFAKEISKADGEDVANLFISQYDGKTNIDEYANSFNLTMAYAKNNFRYDTILNKKGVLSTDAVKKIYQETRIKADKERAEYIKKLNEKMADKKFYKGFIDEAVIDYENTSAEGKVNWNDLDVRQKQAVTFIKGFAKATGMNLVLEHNPDGKYNGKFEVKSNTITIDISNPGKVFQLKETIIPTMSHETTHWMKDKSPELYRNLNEIVFSTLAEHYNSNTEQAIKDKIELLKWADPGKAYTEETAKERNITEEDIIRAEVQRKGKSLDESRDEIIARACEDMLAMSERGKRIFTSLSENDRKTLVEKIKGLVNDLLNWVNDLLNSYESTSTEARIMREYKEELQKASKVWDEMLGKSIKANQSLEKSGAYVHTSETEVTSIGSRDLADFSEAVDTDGKQMFQYRAMVEDEEIYRKMLLKHKDTIGITDKQINDLFNMIDNAVDIISENLEALDYAWDEDINDRAFHPVKANSDKLYKVSLDFSTLCRKRLLQQTIQSTLQEALNKQLSKEESIAIRDELMKVQEEGRKIEVACALCYVESARMKSPKQITKFLDNRESIIKEFFANRSGGSIKEKVANAEKRARETLKKKYPDGMPGKNGVTLDVLTSPLNKMLKDDAAYIRAKKKEAKSSYKLSNHEQSELDVAMKMSVNDFTSAKGLENLAKHHSDLFDAYTSFVRNATHSKGIENDVWWRAGDSDSIGDNLIQQMNAENGLRSQSWSDFQVIHLLDYIAATIELSTKGAKRQSYTKVPDYVKLLGNTGDMINLSLIPERVFDGKLKYDGVEGMAFDIAKKLRDEYHATAGTVCIGINDEQIKMLLADEFIDYVIPYHHSSMSKATRKLMHIPAWESYQDYQSEKSLDDADALARAKEYGVELKKDDKYQKSPNFSEWFDIEEARQIAKMENAHPSDAKAFKKYGKMYGGYKAMQNAANNYLKLCAERGLAPKFSHKNADYTHEANYWKLLIDRKMVDNVTGEIIEQKPIKPIFKESDVLEILNDELARYPQVKADQEYAARKVIEKFLSGEMKVDDSTLEAIKKPIDNVTEVNILESAREDKVMHSERVTEITEDDYKNMKNHFGVTGNFNVAGYMLKDGRLLDFSGKHWGDTTSNYRQVDHRDIQEALPDENNGRDSMVNMISNGNIRLMPEVGGINLAVAPSKNQRVILRRYIEYMSPKEGIMVDIDKVGGDTIKSFTYDMGVSADRVMRDIDNYFKGGTQSELMRFHTAEGDGVLFSERDSYAPTFYSHMGKTIDEMKQDKIGANSAISYLKGRGVKDEEIKWSGIETFLEGKKSVTKAELQEFVAGSMLQIDETVLDGDTAVTLENQEENPNDVYVMRGGEIYDSLTWNEADRVWVSDANGYSFSSEESIRNYYGVGKGKTRWGQYKLDGGDNYREITFKMPNSTYSNRMMQTHWGEDAKGILAHARVQDFEVDGKKILFIEEIQSDWHNSGAKSGYVENGEKDSMDKIVEAYQNAKRAVNFNEGVLDKITAKAMDIVVKISTFEAGSETHTELLAELEGLQSRSNTAREKLKEAKSKLEEVQEEYDKIKHLKDAVPDAPFKNNYHEYVLKSLIRMAAEQGYDSIGWTTADIQSERWSNDYAEGYRIEYDQDIPKFLNKYGKKWGAKVEKTEIGKEDGGWYEVEGTTVWSMPITDSMKESVLYEGQPMYSDREDTSVYDIMGETDRILKENENFKAEIERLNERLKIERKVTKGSILNTNQLLGAAGHLRNISNSTIDKVELARSLKDVYSFIANSENLTWEEVFEKCHTIAEAMLEKSKPEVTVDDYSKQILKDIRNTRISLSESQKKEAQNVFDKNWNRYFFGSVIITDTGIGIESKWQEWASQYPGIFDADISDGDMIVELYNIINTLRESSEVVVEYDMEERTRWLANEIYNQYWNVSPIRTTADKYDKQIKRLNAEHRRAMAELRDDYKSRLEEQHKADKEKYTKLAKKIRERREEQIALAKQHGREKLDKYKENAERKTVVQRITANASTLNKWLTKNSKDYHIHEAMKGPVIKLLQSIDFSSKRMLEKGDPTQKDISFAEAFAEVRAMLQDADNMVEGLEALYGHDLAEDIKRLAERTYSLVGDNNYIINAMTLEELKSLDKLVRHIKKVVTELNKFHTIHHTQGAVNLANEFMEHGEKLGNIKKQHGTPGRFLQFRNRTPYYFFKDLGNVGRKLFEAFQDGWDKLAFNAKRVIDFANETYTEKEVKEWSKETKEFKVTLLDGSERTFKMSIAQIMALRCVSKQEDAIRHLISGGMTLKRIDKKGHVVADYENIPLSMSDIQSILSSLNDRQREVADKLQNFMNTVCSAWGNEISMARFGIEMFGLPDYFPIKVSEATVPTDNTKDIDNASLFRLLNMSFTKSRNKYAEQSIEIGDIFDIFAQHSSDMAKYNALALPVLDFNKFYSIHGKDATGKEYGVVKTLKSVFGDEANGYMRRFVRDINGSQNVSRDVIGNTFFKNAKIASVAANLRVVLLQPTAFHKAGAVMDNKYLMKASAYLKVEPIGMAKKYKKAIANAEKYCGIVQWKSLGYYDTDISKGLTEKIKHADTVKDKIVEKSMKGAEIADKVTFGTLWVACEFEIRETRKDLKVGSEEFYNAIGKRLRDVIYATQVVDSTMTRSDMMRSSDGFDKMKTTFGSEPIIAYNMLLDMVTQYHRDKQEFGKAEARKRNSKKVRKVVTAYVMTNVAAALVESAFDWLRDDDDEEMDVAEFLKLYLKNFAFDMSIGNKLPIVKDVYGLIQGYSSSRMDTQWAQYLFSAATTRKPAKAIRDALRSFSQVSGLAFYNVYRDIMATLNKLDIFTTDDLNEMFEDFLD